MLHNESLICWILSPFKACYSRLCGEVLVLTFSAEDGTSTLFSRGGTSLTFYSIQNTLHTHSTLPQQMSSKRSNPGPTQRVINRGGRVEVESGGGQGRARVSVFPPEARRWTAELSLMAPSSSFWHRHITPPTPPPSPPPLTALPLSLHPP